MSKEFRTLPSEIYYIEDHFAAYCFNKAVYEFGSYVDGKLQNVTGRSNKEIESKRLRIIKRYIPQATGASTFADPVNRST